MCTYSDCRNRDKYYHGLIAEECNQSKLLSTLLDKDVFEFAENKETPEKSSKRLVQTRRATRMFVYFHATLLGGLSRYFVNILSKTENDLRKVEYFSYIRRAYV